MFPEITKKNQNLALVNSKPFADVLTEGYYFDIKSSYGSGGARFLFFDKLQSTLLVSHVNNNRVHLINLKNGKMRWFDHHSASVRSVQTTGSDSVIITASWDGNCMATNFENLEKRHVFTENDMGRSPYIAVSQHNDFVYSYSYDSDKNPERKSNTVRAWSLSDGNLVQKIILRNTHLASRRCGTVEAFSGKMYVVSDTGYLEIFNLYTGQFISEHFFSDLLQSLCIIPSLNMIAFAGDNGNIFICSSSGKLVTKIKAHQYYVSELIIHPQNPDTLISVSHDGTAKIWSMSDLKNPLLPKLVLVDTIQVSSYDSLWSVTSCNDLVLFGGDYGEIEIHQIKNQKAELKGKLVVYNDSFVFVAAGKKAFYTTDLSLIQVFKDNGTPVYGQFADYLLKTTCNFKIFRDLFADNRENVPGLNNQSEGYFQLTQ